MVTRPKTKQAQSYLFRLPLPALALDKAAVGKSTLRSTAGRRSLRSSPIPQTPADYTYTHIQTYWLQTITHTDTSPKPPIPTPPSLWTASLTSESGTSAKLGCRTWMAACQSWITSPVAKSCVYVVIMCFLLLRCFSCSHTVLPKGA